MFFVSLLFNSMILIKIEIESRLNCIDIIAYHRRKTAVMSANCRFLYSPGVNSVQTWLTLNYGLVSFSSIFHPAMA